MTDTPVPDEIEVVRAAEALYTDACLRIQNPHVRPWASAESHFHDEYTDRARRLLAGEIRSIGAAWLRTELRHIEVEDIPRAIEMLAERYTAVLGTLPVQFSRS